MSRRQRGAVVLRILIVFSVLVLNTGLAGAANEMRASFLWTRAQVSQLRFEPKTYRQNAVRLTFSDPREGGEIEKIVFDPVFIPRRTTSDGGTISDFFVTTTIKSPKGREDISETALCDWASGKAVATCVIEDDGGRFEIAALPAVANKTRSLELVMRPIDGYRGFRIADAGASEPAAVEVKLVGSVKRLSAKIVFEPQ